MSNITLKQSPIIEFSSLDLIAQEVEKRLSVYNFDMLVVDEENVKAIKELRATLNKELKDFETVRKNIKQGVLNPYEEFEKSYKEKISNKYSEADSKLKLAIDKVENGINAKKELELMEYFEECKYAKNLAFLEWTQANIKVGLADSVKSLKTEVKSFVDMVDGDIELIKTQAHADRILVQYKRTLDVRNSIAQVLRDVEQENLLKAVVEVKEEPKEEPKIVEPIIVEPEEVLSVSFRVTGTRNQLIELRSYMKEKGLKYE